MTLSSYSTTPLWLRDAKISPDGKQIVFRYKGNIYKVPANGGKAIQLTTQSSFESGPIWSNDGKRIAFASDREGNNEIYIMDAEGGSAKRLTIGSANKTPWAFTKDDKYIIFSASIQDPAKSALFPTTAMTEVYKVPVNGGRIMQILATPAEMVNFSKDGKEFLYQDQKGFENKWRKHHTSSITRDIWLYDSKSNTHKNLTAHAGEDRNPSFSPDNKGVYFLSERDKGSMNVYYFPIDNPTNT
jgi:Periplasmic component of the Tol biopolymer transport system